MARFDAGLPEDTYIHKLRMMPSLPVGNFVLMDMTSRVFVTRGTMEQMKKYGYLHVPGWQCVVNLDDKDGFRALNGEEMEELYCNATGRVWSGSADELRYELRRLAGTLPVLQWNSAQLNYALAQKVEEDRKNWAAWCAANPVPVHVPENGPLRPGSAPGAAGPGNPTAPVRPKAGSATGRVWEICDAALAAIGKVTDWKAFKKSVLLLGVNEGINESTCSVQFGKWRLSNGF